MFLIINPLEYNLSDVLLCKISNGIHCGNSLAKNCFSKSRRCWTAKNCWTLSYQASLPAADKSVGAGKISDNRPNMAMLYLWNIKNLFGTGMVFNSIASKPALNLISVTSASDPDFKICVMPARFCCGKYWLKADCIRELYSL